MSSRAQDDIEVNKSFTLCLFIPLQELHLEKVKALTIQR